MAQNIDTILIEQNPRWVGDKFDTSLANTLWNELSSQLKSIVILELSHGAVIESIQKDTVSQTISVRIEGMPCSPINNDELQMRILAQSGHPFWN